MEGVESVLQRVYEVGESNIFTCDIVRGELIFMANNSRNKKQNHIKVEKFLQDISIYYLDEETTRI